MEMQQKMENATEMTSEVLTDYLPITLVRPYIERTVHTTEMDEILQKDGMCILCGDGGSGKSTLAMHYALKQQRDSIERKEWPFLVVRIIQEVTKTNLLQELQRMGRELKINDEIIEKETKQDIQKYCRELTRLIYNQLEKLGQRLILILDNPQDSTVLADCNHYRDGLEKTVQVFVTTRNHHAFLDHKYSQITLSTFTYEEGQVYLEKRLRSHRTGQTEEIFNSSAYKLLKTVGRTPLRLKLASGYLQENRFMTVDEYVDMHRISNPPEGVLPEVQLGLEALDSMSQLMMHYSTKLETSYIPFGLFQYLFKVDEKELRKEIIDPLECLSLVTVLLGRDNENGYGIQIHEEVRASCVHYKEWKEEANISEESLVNDIVSAVSEKMPGVKSVGDDDWQQAQLYAPQGINVVEGAENVLGNNTSLAKLFDRVARYESLLCSFQQSLIYREKALKIDQEIHDNKPHPNLTLSLNNSGNAYCELGDTQTGLEYLGKALKMQQQLYGDKPHSDVASSLNNIGLVHYDLDNMQEALEYHENALKIEQHLYGDKPHSGVATSFNNIGNAYNKLGNIQKALEHYEEALAMRQQLYGDKPHSNVATSLNNIGDAYRNLSDIQKALEYYNRSLKIRQQLHGDNPHSNVASSFNNIGLAYSDLGDSQKALEFHERSLKMKQQLYGDKPHSDVVSSLNNIGLVHYNLGDAQKGLEYHEEALAMRQQLYGEKPHSDVARSLNNIGLVYKYLGNIQEALQYYETALKIGEEIYGDKPHSDVATSLINIGAAYQELGDINKALEFYEKGFKMYKEIYGDKPHSDVADSLINIGTAYSGLGVIQTALEFYEQSLRMQQQIYGDKSHPDVASSLNNIGNAYSKLGDIQTALEYYNQSSNTFQKIYGDKPHSDVADSLNNIGNAYHELGDIQKALEYYGKALTMRQELHGDTPHLDVAKSLYWLGDTYEKLGKEDIAKQCYQKGLAISQKLSHSAAAEKYENAFEAKLSVLFISGIILPAFISITLISMVVLLSNIKKINRKTFF